MKVEGRMMVVASSSLVVHDGCSSDQSEPATPTVHPASSVEEVMEPGPATVRAKEPGFAPWTDDGEARRGDDRG